MEFDKKLTFRQTEVLLSIYKRLKKYGFAHAGGIVTDSGVSIATVGNHLAKLKEFEFIDQPENKKVKYLNFNDKIILTPEGETHAESHLASIKATNDDSITTIYEKNKMQYQNRSDSRRKSGYNIDSKSPFSKIFNEIMMENKTEPVVTSLAMYSELDSQLAMLSKSGSSLYSKLSFSNLNTEIRSGRIASIAIPIALRGNIRQQELFKILGDGWSWPGTANVKSLYRYLGESTSLDLIEKRGDTYFTKKPTTTDSITWLSSKVGSAFQNTISLNPKAALVVFRETFRYPTMEQLIDPRDSNSIWLNKIYERMTDKKEYAKVIKKGLDILENEARIVTPYEDEYLIPRTIIRRVESLPEIEEKFAFLMKNAKSGNLAAQILLTVTAHPGITTDDLFEEINKNSKLSATEENTEIERAIKYLSDVGLLDVSRSYYPENSPLRLHAFTQIPHLESNFSNLSKTNSSEANAAIKGIQLSLLTTVNELFPRNEEKELFYSIINELADKKSISLDQIEGDNRSFGRKVELLANTAMKPFVIIDPSFSYLELSNSKLTKIFFEVVQNSMFNNKESLSIYSSMLDDTVVRDVNYYRTIEADAKEFVEDLRKQSFKHDKKKYDL